MELDNSEQTARRPCVKLIIAAVDFAPNDETDEAIEFGLELARDAGGFPMAQECRLEYDGDFYCDDKTSVACELRRALKN